MNIATVMDELGEALAVIPGLRVSPYWADRITPPAAIVGWPDPLEYDATFARGADRFTLPITVLTGKVSARSARDQLGAYANGGAPEPSVTFVGVGAGTASADSGALVTLSPVLPDDIEADDLLLCLASVRNADTASVNTPSGWTLLGSTNTNNMRLFGKVATGADTAPGVTFTGGSTNVTGLAQCCALRGASTDLTTIVTASNVNSFGTAQNIAFASLTMPSTTDFGIRCGFKQDDWTSVAEVSHFTRIGEVTSTLGNDSGMIWDYQTGTTGWIGGNYVVTGGSTAQSRALSVSLAAGDPNPNRSLKYALEVNEYTNFRVRVMRASIEVITVAEVDYLAGVFDVDIIGTGA